MDLSATLNRFLIWQIGIVSNCAKNVRENTDTACPVKVEFIAWKADYKLEIVKNIYSALLLLNFVIQNLYIKYHILKFRASSLNLKYVKYIFSCIDVSKSLNSFPE